MSSDIPFSMVHSQGKETFVLSRKSSWLNRLGLIISIALGTTQASLLNLLELTVAKRTPICLAQLITSGGPWAVSRCQSCA